MKRFFTMFLSIYGLSCLTAQDLEIKFDHIIPKWYFIYEDTNYNLGTQTQLDGKNSIGTGLIPLVDNEFGYLLGTQINSDFQNDGGPLTKVRLNDGVIMWNKYYNSDNKDDQNYNRYMFIDDKLIVTGRKRTKYSKKVESSWDIGGYSTAFVRILDKNNGEVTSDYYDEKDTVGVFDIFVKYVIFPFGHEFFNFYREARGSTVGLNVSKFITETGKTIECQFLPFKEPINADKIENASWYYIKHNDKYLITFYNYESKDTTIYPNISGLEVYTYTNGSFTSTKYIDMSTYFRRLPKFDLNLFWPIEDVNGNLVYTKNYRLKGQANPRFSLFRFNSTFDLVQFIPEIRLDSINYSYNSIMPFYSDQYSTYMIGQTSLPDVKGMDVLQVKNDGSIRIIGHLTTGTENFKITGIRLNMNDKGNIIVAGTWDKKALAVMGFHISDFGINLSSEDEKIKDPAPLMTVSPNPASDDLTMYITDEKYRRGTVCIYNLSGKKVHQQKSSHGDTMNVRDLPQGSYIVQFSPDSRPGYFLTTKLVKE